MPKARSTNETRAATRAKVKSHRDRLRAQGLRPIQIWVPDTKTPRFAEEARRQSLLANATAYAAEDQAFVDSISWFGSDEGR